MDQIAIVTTVVVGFLLSLLLWRESWLRRSYQLRRALRGCLPEDAALVYFRHQTRWRQWERDYEGGDEVALARLHVAVDLRLGASGLRDLCAMIRVRQRISGEVFVPERQIRQMIEIVRGSTWQDRLAEFA